MLPDRAFAGQRSVSKMADDSAIQINQVRHRVFENVIWELWLHY